MSLLYIDENGAIIGIENNRITVSCKNGLKRSLPIETLEGITLLGKAQLTTQCMEEVLKKGIPVSFFSKGGRYFGRLVSTGAAKPELQRRQSRLYNEEFALELSKRIIRAKIKNQMVLIRRYSNNTNVEISENIKYMRIALEKIAMVESIPELIGYEGMAAKEYFRALSKCIYEDFKFKGRNRRPPRDPFNSMISLGYSILMNELYNEIEVKGLNPYFGFMHRDAERHPTLASDMMEEWRAVIIDSVVMSLINGHEVRREGFEFDEEDGACYISKTVLDVYLKKLENKMKTSVKYLSYESNAVSFRRAISLQIGRLVKAIYDEDATVYIPIEIR